MKNKSALWDGKASMVDYYTGTFDYGLLPSICEWLDESSIPYEIDEDIINFKQYPEFTVPENLSPAPYDYQIEYTKYALKNKRCIILSPTGSGKSLIVYMLANFYLQQKDLPILIVTPRVDLVTQLRNDFIDYDSRMENLVQVIHAGQSHKITKPIVISTWQSIYENRKKYFQNFKCVIADEVHSYKADQISKIIEKCVNAENKVGLTATLQDTETDILKLEGLFGAPYQIVDEVGLMEKDVLSKLKVNAILLNHSCVQPYTYKEESDYITGCDNRNKFISKLSKSVTEKRGNTLVLVDKVDKHAKPLYKRIKKLHPKTFLIHGKIKPETRERIKDYIKNNSDCILIATYGTFQIGINIKNIYNIVLGQGGKSKIRLIQSIGRGLRKLKDKILHVYDLGDSLEYALDHFEERIELYQRYGYPLANMKYNI